MLKQIMFSDFLTKLNKFERDNNLQCTDLIANGRQTVLNMCNHTNNIEHLTKLMDGFLEFISSLTICVSNSTENEVQFAPLEDSVIQRYHNKNLTLKREIVLIANMDLQCPICNEWLYQVTSSNCNHTFCKLCILKWLRINKTCPICRTPIQYITNAIAVDNFISNLCSIFGGKFKGQRDAIKSTRINSITGNEVEQSIAENEFGIEMGDPNEVPLLPPTQGMNLRSNSNNPSEQQGQALVITPEGNLVDNLTIEQSIAEENSFIDQLDNAMRVNNPNDITVLPFSEVERMNSLLNSANSRTQNNPRPSRYRRSLNINPNIEQLIEQNSFVGRVCSGTRMRFPIVVPLEPPRPQAPRMTLRDRLNVRDPSNSRSSPIIPPATAHSNALQSEGSSHGNMTMEEAMEDVAFINQLDNATQMIQPNMVPLLPPSQGSRMNLRERSNSNDPSRVQLSYRRSHR